MKITLIICCTIVLVIFLITEAFVTANRDDNLYNEHKKQLENEHAIKMEKIRRGDKI